MQAISKAKQAVYEFAKDVVRWLDSQISAFREAGAHKFTKKTWNNLEPMRFVLILLAHIEMRFSSSPQRFD
jgi:hypothetical protein